MRRRLLAPDRLAALFPVAVMACVVSACLTTWWLYGTEMIDLQVYRAGASALLHGHAMYQARPRGSFLVFTYPPFAAMVLAPLAILPNLGAQIVLTALSAAALLAVAATGVRVATPAWPRRSQWTVALAVCAAAPLLEPVRDTIRSGQVNLLLMALVVIDICGPRPSRSRGLLVGLATAVKITPGIFILYLFATRRIREGVTATLATGAATAVAFLIAPSASWQYWTNLVFDDRRVGRAAFVWNQSLRGALARLAGSPERAFLCWVVVAGVVLFAGLAAAAAMARSGDELFGLGLAALTGLLISPISWHHHWVWALPLGLALWRRRLSLGRPARLAIAAVWTMTFCVASLWWWSHPGPIDYRLGGHQLVANSYVIAGLALVAAVWVELGLASHRRPEASPGVARALAAP